jgi:hypothetical protein
MSKNAQAIMETITDLEERVNNAWETYVRLHAELIHAKQQAAAACSHETFLAEDDGDCHSSGWYYTCQTCHHVTRVKPVAKKIVYVR